MSGTRLVLFAWVIMSVADGLHMGSYTGGAVALMSLAVLALSAPVLAPRRLALNRPTRTELGLALTTVTVLYPYASIVPENNPRLYQGPAMLFLGLAVGLVCLPMRPRVSALGGAVVLMSAVAAGIFMIRRAAEPPIDVWFLTEGSADSIVHGYDMYQGHWPGSPGIDEGFPYLPGLGLLVAPLRLVGLDVRYGLLLAGVASAILIWRMAPGRSGPWLAAMLLAVPGYPSLVALAWTEPLLLFPVILVFVWVRQDRAAWAVVAFGVALATKQHMLLLCPVLAAWPRFGLRRVLQAAAGAAVVTLPWVFVGPHSFLDGALWLNLHLEPRRDSLSLYTWAMQQGWRAPFAVVCGITLAALATAISVLRRRASPPLVALASAWVLAIFHLVNKQSFYNEWWLAITLVVLALALTDDEIKPVAAPA